MDWKKWIKAAGIRAIKTAAQTAIATIGAAAVLSEVNWAVVASASALAAILSLLTSLAGLPETKEIEVYYNTPYPNADEIDDKV
jgi:hypothetical protein